MWGVKSRNWNSSAKKEEIESVEDYDSTEILNARTAIPLIVYSTSALRSVSPTLLIEFELNSCMESILVSIIEVHDWLFGLVAEKSQESEWIEIWTFAKTIYHLIKCDSKPRQSGSHLRFSFNYKFCWSPLVCQFSNGHFMVFSCVWVIAVIWYCQWL